MLFVFNFVCKLSKVAFLKCIEVFWNTWLNSAEAGKILSLFSGTLESSLKLDTQRCTFVSLHQLSQLLPPLSLEFRRALVLSNFSSKCGNKKVGEQTAVSAPLYVGFGIRARPSLNGEKLR